MHLQNVRVAFICTFIYYFVTFVKNMKMKLNKNVKVFITYLVFYEFY